MKFNTRQNPTTFLSKFNLLVFLGKMISYGVIVAGKLPCPLISFVHHIYQIPTTQLKRGHSRLYPATAVNYLSSEFLQVVLGNHCNDAIKRVHAIETHYTIDTNRSLIEGLFKRVMRTSIVK